MIMNMTGGSASDVEFAQTNAEITRAVTLEKIEVPTSINGVALNQVLNTYNKSDLWARMVWSTKKILIPEYFTSANIGQYLTGKWYSALEEVECHSIYFLFNYEHQHVNLHAIRLPKAEGEIGFAIFPLVANGTTVPVTHKTVTAHAPKATSISPAEFGTEDNIVTLDADFENCVTFGANRRNLKQGRCWNGTIELPNCETITYTYPDAGEATIYLPKVQQFTNYFMDGAQTSGGIVHLYVGPDLSMLANINASWWATFGSHVDLHIPPGDSTTKQMLDGEGIPYTQDYII